MMTLSEVWADVDRSAQGEPCLWESGGGQTNTGGAQLIAGSKLEPKVPVYVRRKGHLAGGPHAKVPVVVGDHVVRSRHHRGDFDHEVYVVETFRGDQVLLIPIAQFTEGEWRGNPPLFPDEGDVKDWGRTALILSSEEKATEYHCRQPHFIEEGGE